MLMLKAAFAAFALALTASGSMACAKPIQAPLPLENPNLWFAGVSKPKTVKQGGTVEFSLDIDSEGRVSECHVIKSSGSEPLDELTCDVLLKRGRFKKPTKEDGSPSTGTYWSKIRW